MRIKELRQERGLTQAEVANAIKTSQRNIGRWENGEHEPTASFIFLLANFFEVSSDYLLGLEDDFGTRTTAPMNGSLSYSSEEHKIIEQYRSLPKQLQELIRNQLEIYCAPETLNKSDKKV